MESAQALLGMLGAGVGAILGILALANRIDSSLETKIISVLLASGLTREGHHGEWANGSHNLPDSVHTIWQSIEANAAQIHEVNKRLESMKDDRP